MAWEYRITTGSVMHDGLRIGSGYSGHGDGINNPKLCAVHDIGPIPPGQYDIGLSFDDPGGKGPCVMHLTPKASTEVHGRSGFMIHGDNAAMDRSASHGCIILASPCRRAIASSSDSLLEVTE